MAGQVTWDGAPISPEQPHGATIIVYRRTDERTEYLVLHRAHAGLEEEGDWAWTPPSGARHPGEPVEACARRELKEETGLELSLQPTDLGTEDWRLYLAIAPPETVITLSAEHDLYRWLSAGEAVRVCRPDIVAEQVQRAAEHVEGERR